MEHRTHPAMNADIKTAPKGNIRSLRTLMGYLKPYRIGVVGAVVALCFTASSVLGLGGALRYLIDEGLSKGNPHLLDQAFVLLLSVTLILAAASYARFYLVSSIGEQVVADIRRDVFAHILRQDIAFFETNRTGELLSRITTDTTLLQAVVGSSLSTAARNILMLVGGLVLLVITSFKLTGYVLLIVPAVVVPIIVLGRKVRVLSRATQERVADLSAQAEEALGAMHSIQTLAIAPHVESQFFGAVNQTIATAMGRIRLRAALTALVIALVFGAVVLVLWAGGRDVLAGTMSAGELSAFVFYAIMVASSTGAISEIISDLQRAAGACERLMELLQLQPSIAAPAHPSELPSPVRGTIAFNQITFSYPSRPDVCTARHIQLNIAAGERVAIVGPSGAGKSTLLHLLLRLYDPQQGNITLDGVDIRAFDPLVLRSHMALVPQDPVIFSASALDNIALGKPNATEAEIMEAAEAAAVLEFLQGLPQGLHTHLGEKGVRLSGGQRQRIALARAFVRNPRVLLLDEATSALDSENERRVQEACERLMHQRTTLVVAHRLATVLSADRILVMENGEIHAMGTHEELLCSSTLYARLAALQFGTSAAA